jgi:hypothetical protein
MGAVMTGCSNNDELQQPESVKRTVTLTTTVSLDGGAGTRALDVSTGVKTFAVDDQISFVYKNTSDETKLAVSEKLTQSDISADGKTATIYVALEDPATDSQLRMIYPATMANIPMSTSASIDDAGTINLGMLQTGQQGYEGELDYYDLAVFDGTLSGYALPASVTLANKLAICAFTIKNADGTQDITTTITNLTISDGTYNYSISRSNLISPIYVAMMPVDDANIEMTATDNDGQHYAKSLTNITYAANNIYPLAMRMTESFKTYSTLPVGTHLNVGDQLDLSTEFNINGILDEINNTPKALNPSDAPYTLVRANIAGTTVTEADDGAQYVFKDKNGTYYGVAAGIPASAATDGIFVSGYYSGNHSYTMHPHVNLANVTTAYTAQTNECLYGTLGSEVQISIANNATVWLGGVSINADGTMTGEYAGITCLGNATINLTGGTTNTVRGMADDYSGIFVPYNDTGEGDEYTLTIQGTGTLNAFGGLNAAGIGANSLYDSGNIVIAGGIINATGGGNAAGIGSSYLTTSGRKYTCGNITISGGTVTATGGYYAAGIGSAYFGGCGYININGGTVTASGGSKAAGIGSGEDGFCNDITISSGVTSVTATKGEYAPYSIGAGANYSTCGTVTIGGTEYYDSSNFQNDGDTYLATSPLVYPAP